jgi:hypothetical protein
LGAWFELNRLNEAFLLGYSAKNLTCGLLTDVKLPSGRVGHGFQRRTTMKNELEMTLSSRRPLTASFAREQITALDDFGGGLLRPEASEFEPIRTPFNPADLGGPVQWLAKPQGEFLYQK